MTKNTKLYLTGLVLIAAISATTVIGVGMLTAPRQPTPTPNAKTKNITVADSGTTVTINKGDKLQLTLKNYGDGGYTWTIKRQDTGKLALVSQIHINGTGGLGDFGSDLWTFMALQPGTSSLEMVCARPWKTSDVCATFNIEVVIQ